MVTMDTSDVRVLSGQVTELLDQAPPTITTDAEVQTATSWLAAARTRRKEIEAFFDRLIKPFKEAVKSHQAECATLLNPIQDRESRVNAAILTYRTRVIAEAAKAQEQANRQHERDMVRAEKKGQDVALVPPPPVIETPASSVQTEAGQVVFRKVRKFEIVDPAKVPPEYCKPDEVLIGKGVRAGILKASVWLKVWEEECTSVRG